MNFGGTYTLANIQTSVFSKNQNTQKSLTPLHWHESSHKNGSCGEMMIFLGLDTPWSLTGSSAACHCWWFRWCLGPSEVPPTLDRTSSSQTEK